MTHPLDGVKEKIARAEAHLVTTRAELQAHKSKCTVLAKKHPNANSLFDFYANFPQPPLSLSCIISDCLHNLLTALDYLVYELASTNGGLKIHNMFPICNASNVYNRQVQERHRLHNVPLEAQAIIERVQPYNAKGRKRFSHPLYILNKLINEDRYRTLALTVTCRAYPTFLLNEPNGRTIIEGTSITEAFQDGARISEQRLTGIQLEEVVMNIQRGIYLPFKDLPWTDSSADTVLGAVVWFVKKQVVPRFEPFFDQPTDRAVAIAAKSKG